MTRKTLSVLAALLTTALPLSAHADYHGGGATNWSGFYIGGSVGYGIADTAFTHSLDDGDAFERTRADISSDGVTGTISIGYDVNLHSNLVAGVFADYTFGELDGSGAYAIGPPSQFSLEYDDTWAIGARLGLARHGGSLWYVTAGYTETDLTLSDDFGTLGRDLKGYFLGGGVEQNLHHHGLSLKLEYRVSDYGSETIYEDVEECCFERYDVDSKVHAIRLGLTYKFGRREAEAVPLK